MDSTEEAFVAQVREASIAQVTHGKPSVRAETECSEDGDSETGTSEVSSTLTGLPWDGTMALARTSGHDLANPDNMAVFWSRRKQLDLRKTLQLYVYLQIHQPMADRKSEW
ncbi:hypothetical protein NP493_2282g00008 [Ridgeia piscesae]|uniref:Uncharacterized protein n=1 Tax=Ridgeia piscesae TaxID=27915 RepID=A0AAD9JIK1_RIDPI|nr:hypothetical protein NP493_2282g00008 [Ridgeia piscesae]